MNNIIIDKRFLPKNNTSSSRKKFIDRYKGAIKSRIKEIVSKNSIKNFNKGSKKIKIEVDDLDEPQFELDSESGNQKRIYIGNKKFKKGDLFPKSRSGSQKGSKAGGRGDGEDSFEFILTEKEFTDLFFEDLELPNLIKREFIGSAWEVQHAGFSRYGGPSSLNIKKTMLNSLGRRIAIKNGRNKLNQCDGCMNNDPINESGHHVSAYPNGNIVCTKNLYKSSRKIQYIEDIDLRYNFKEKVDVPTTKAVMFCLMDVSGSMGEREKDIAKRFFILLNLFLRRNYDIVDIVFIRHTEEAEEVDEEKFFYDRASGGTIVSSGYDKINEIITSRYDPEQWNVYIAQTTDGDNWEDDNSYMEEVLTQKLLPITQYFAYIDIASGAYRYFDSKAKSGLMEIMERLMINNGNLQARMVQDYRQIYPVFRSLFKKEK